MQCAGSAQSVQRPVIARGKELPYQDNSATARMNIADNWAPLLISALLVGILCCVIVALHKLRRIHLFLFRLAREHSPDIVTDRVFSQVHALHDLYLELGVYHGLPPMRGWAASPDFLLPLAREVLRSKPLNIVECGSGSSTVVLAICVKRNGMGHVFSLDHDAQFADATRRKP